VSTKRRQDHWVSSSLPASYHLTGRYRGQSGRPIRKTDGNRESGAVMIRPTAGTTRKATIQLWSSGMSWMLVECILSIRLQY